MNKKKLHEYLINRGWAVDDCGDFYIYSKNENVHIDLESAILTQSENAWGYYKEKGYLSGTG